MSILSDLKEKAWSLYADRLKLRELVNKGRITCYTCYCQLEYRSLNCQGGHFLPRGGFPGLTFHPDNSRCQCGNCNGPLRGNQVVFRENLIREIGVEWVEKLESMKHMPLKLSRSDYKDMIEELKKDIKELKRQL